MPIDPNTQGRSTSERIEHALIDLLLSSDFPERKYTCDLGDGNEAPGDKYKVLIDYATSRTPRDILVKESRKRLGAGKCVAEGPFSPKVTEQQVRVLVAWACPVDTSHFEETQPVIVPADGPKPALALRLSESDVSHPPRQTPERGTRATFTFSVQHLIP